MNLSLASKNTTTPQQTHMLTLVQAVNMALRHAMQENPGVLILGEDVARNGGVFRATENLYQEFGEQRVMDTPLAENLISGLCVGLSTQGMIPVAEIQFMGFVYAAIEHLVSHAGRMRHRTRGRLSCPMVMRMPYGGGIHAPEHHSESTEAMLAHIPGIRVVVPSSPARAYGLLLSAIRDPDPVVFLEPKRIYRAGEQPVNCDMQGLPLDTCFRLRDGKDITLISWGAMIQETLEAASLLADKNIQCDVLDLATLKPIDHESIIDSVNRTGRCLIIQEAARSCSIGAEIAALVAEKALFSLKAPIQRVSGYDSVMPYLKTEHYYMPRCSDIVSSALGLMEYE